MTTHARKAVPGAVRGRRPKLHPSSADQVYWLVSWGYTQQDVADHLGVHRSTLLRVSKKEADLRNALKEGRVAFACRQAAEAAAKATEAKAQERRMVRQAVAEVGELLDAVPAPPATESRAKQLPSGLGSLVADRHDLPDLPLPPHDVAASEPVPLDDPLGDWR